MIKTFYNRIHLKETFLKIYNRSKLGNCKFLAQRANSNRLKNCQNKFIIKDNGTETV